ncbi:sensor domain-containing diguanylate cyclase [Giesbergeria anulus]|uniref:diguanylate cyclase n=1 Tax=Giesbergeria anulus TaxID=180197 RepID=A0A1H9J5C4_9BURK|nr:diguanylate cyclase [Giesbergeria anulus]SEQ82080.1 diguanylate cyclase (GGDEF) domain-containing protein [Giesbergeria anulus]
MTRRCLLLILLLLGCCQKWALAVEIRAYAGKTPLVSDIEALEDRTGQLTIEAVRQLAQAGRFTPVSNADGDLNFGFTASAYWLRIRLQRQPEAASRWLLEVPYGQINTLQWYPPQGEVLSTGNDLPLSSRPVFHRHFVFPVELDTTEQVFYLRATSSYSLTLPLVLWNIKGFLRHEQGELIWQFLYYGALLSLLLYNFLLYCSLGDKRFLFYSLYAAFLGLGMLAGNGYGRLYLWTEAPAFDAISQSSIFCLAALFGAHFTRLFLQTGQRAPHLDRWLQGHAVAFLLLACGFGASLYWAVPILWLNQWMLFNALGMGAAIAVAGWRVQRTGAHHIRFFLLAWGVLWFGVVVAGLRAFGWLPSNVLTSYALQIASAFEMLLLSLALADIIHAERRSREQSQQQALQAQQQMLEVLRHSEEKLERAVRERTAELERANAQLQVLGTTDSLTGLANRRRFDQVLANAWAHASSSGQPIALIMLDVDHFKQYNDHYGHVAGDQCLRQVGQVLAQYVELPEELVARYGGEEFAVIIMGRGATEVCALAERLRSGIEGLAIPHACASPGVVTISLGVASLVPTALGDGPDALIRIADAELYRAKQSGRNRVQCAHGFA